MNRNYAYRKDEDGGVVIFSIMKHAIAKVVVIALERERIRNIPKVFEEPTQVSIEGRDGLKKRTH